MTATVKTYRYELDPGSKKFRCPSCRKKCFVRYIDNKAKADEYLPEKYGRCDRESSCGYFLDPYNEGYRDGAPDWKDKPKEEPEPPDFINDDIFQASLKGYRNNNFVQYLKTLFDGRTVDELIKKYYVGTSKFDWYCGRSGACVFWQIDSNESIRSGKVMLYDNSGHRVKNLKPLFIGFIQS